MGDVRDARTEMLRTLLLGLNLVEHLLNERLTGLLEQALEPCKLLQGKAYRAPVSCLGR